MDVWRNLTTARATRPGKRVSMRYLQTFGEGGLEARLAEVTRERDHLRTAHERLRLELDLLKRRIFLAKAERVDTAQLEFAVKLAELNRIAETPKATPAEGDKPARAQLEAEQLEREVGTLTIPAVEALAPSTPA